jgi:hypothetical protein
VGILPARRLRDARGGLRVGDAVDAGSRVVIAVVAVAEAVRGLVRVLTADRDLSGLRVDHARAHHALVGDGVEIHVRPAVGDGLALARVRVGVAVRAVFLPRHVGMLRHAGLRRVVVVLAVLAVPRHIAQHRLEGARQIAIETSQPPASLRHLGPVQDDGLLAVGRVILAVWVEPGARDANQLSVAESEAPDRHVAVGDEEGSGPVGPVQLAHERGLNRNAEEARDRDHRVATLGPVEVGVASRVLDDPKPCRRGVRSAEVVAALVTRLLGQRRGAIDPGDARLGGAGESCIHGMCLVSVT